MGIVRTRTAGILFVRSCLRYPGRKYRFAIISKIPDLNVIKISRDSSPLQVEDDLALKIKRQWRQRENGIPTDTKNGSVGFPTLSDSV